MFGPVPRFQTLSFYFLQHRWIYFVGCFPTIIEFVGHLCAKESVTFLKESLKRDPFPLCMTTLLLLFTGKNPLLKPGQSSGGGDTEKATIYQKYSKSLWGSAKASRESTVEQENVDKKREEYTTKASTAAQTPWIISVISETAYAPNWKNIIRKVSISKCVITVVFKCTVFSRI